LFCLSRTPIVAIFCSFAIVWFSSCDLLDTQSLCSLAVLKQCRMVYWSRIRSLCPFPWSEWLTCQRKAPSIFDWHCLFSSKCQPWLLPHPWIGTHLSIYLFVRCYRNVHHCMWRSTTIQSWCSDLHVISSAWWSDIPWLVVQSSLDGQWSLIEVPSLSVSLIRCLNDHIPVVTEVKVSVVWQLRNNIEVSFNIQTEVFIELTLSWLSLPFINVDDVPLLVDFSVLSPGKNVSVFLVNSSSDIKYSSLLIDNKLSLVSEQLPPSWSGSSAPDVVTLHVERVWFPVVILKSLGHWVEEPLLGLSILDVSLKLHIVGSNTFSKSLHWKSWSDVEWSVSAESEIFINSAILGLTSLVNIQHSPFLMVALVVSIDTNWLAFLVLLAFDFKDLWVLPVDELLVLILEDLPPSWVGAPDLHVIGSSRWLDVPWLVV